MSAYFPVRELSTYIKKWEIKARVTKKAPMRTYNTERGQGKLFSVDLLDGDSSEIRASFFNQAADKFFDVLQEGEVFTFARGSVRVANKKFNNLGHSYELNFDTDAIITPMAEDASIKSIRYTFKALGQLNDLELPATVDLMVMVKSFEPAREQTMNDSRSVTIQDLVVVDQSDCQINLTLWGDHANQPDELLTGEPVVLIKGVGVRDFRGRTLSASGQAQLRFIAQDQVAASGLDPLVMEDVQRLISVCGNKSQYNNLSNAMGVSSAPATECTMEHFRELSNSETVGPNPLYFTMYGKLLNVRTATQAGDQLPLYFSPTDGSGGPAKLRAYCLFYDSTGIVGLTGFDDSIRVVLGKSAQEIQELETKGGQEAIQELLDARYHGQPFQLRCRLRDEEYNGQTRVRSVLNSAVELSFGDRAQILCKEVKDLYDYSADSIFA